jgi:hypothetical protein
MDEALVKEAKDVVRVIEEMAEKHWEERERKWWEQADELGKYLPQVKKELVRCAREAFIDGYMARMLEEANDPHSPRKVR